MAGPAIPDDAVVALPDKGTDKLICKVGSACEGLDPRGLPGLGTPPALCKVYKRCACPYFCTCAADSTPGPSQAAPAPAADPSAGQSSDVTEEGSIAMSRLPHWPRLCSLARWSPLGRFPWVDGRMRTAPTASGTMLTTLLAPRPRALRPSFAGGRCSVKGTWRKVAPPAWRAGGAADLRCRSRAALSPSASCLLRSRPG